MQILYLKSLPKRKSEMPTKTDKNISYDSTDFVYVDEEIENVRLDIRYATAYNFVGDVIDGYSLPLAMMTKESVAALKEAAKDFKAMGCGIWIFDAYRPERAVQHFLRWGEDTNDTRMKNDFYPEMSKSDVISQGYIAVRSNHTHGSTIDLTLYSLEHGYPLDMGGTFDLFSERSAPDFEDITDIQKENRRILRETMEKHGFFISDIEWWHFTLKNQPYEDIFFDFPVDRKF